MCRVRMAGQDKGRARRAQKQGTEQEMVKQAGDVSELQVRYKAKWLCG